MSANRELDSFAYAVSHDQRAPLPAVNGFAQARLEDYEDRLDDQAKSCLEQIRLANLKMGDLNFYGPVFHPLRRCERLPGGKPLKTTTSRRK